MTAFWWAVLAASIWGIVPLVEKAGLSKVEPLTGIFYRCIGVVVAMTFFGLFLLKPEQIKAVDTRSALLLIVGGFLASFVAQIAFYQGLKMGEVSRFVPIAGSYPLITFVLGILIFREQLTVLKGAGVFLITMGVWCLNIK